MAPAAAKGLLAALALHGTAPCLGGSAGAAADGALEDGLSLVQTSQMAGNGVEAHLQTFALFSDAIAKRLLRTFVRSSPKHHHDKHHDKGKSTATVGSNASAEGSGLDLARQLAAAEEAAKARDASEPAAQAKRKKGKKGKLARRGDEDDDALKCSKADFEAVDWHAKGLLSQYGKPVGDALKANDTNTTFSLIANMVPKECEMARLLSPAGVRWANLQTCMTRASNASEACASCPVTFLQRVAGKSIVEVPFSCAAKCGAVPAVAFKCAEDETQECKDSVLEKMAPCLRCAAPQLVRMGMCAGLPSTDTMKGKLKALLDAIDSGPEDLDKLLEAEASDGREELRKSRGSPVLTKIMALAMTAVLD